MRVLEKRRRNQFMTINAEPKRLYSTRIGIALRQARLACAAVLGLACHIGFAAEATPMEQVAVAPEPKTAPGAELFGTERICRLRLVIAAEDIVVLRRDSRYYVPAVVHDGDEVFQQVGIHLKGSTGSFRSIDDKPALTLSFSKFVPGQTFHGLRKIHLNNSVEDASYFNEYAGSQLFRAAKVPAPRITHALVELNGRRLGLYVLKEGFAEEFLSQYFQKTNGNLYDTGVGYDVDEALDKDQGDGPDDRSDLQALALAAHEADPLKRWHQLGKVLDLERFISFMAMEVITGHRDGYCLARNNFRVYQDLDTGKMVFFPHGMDQLFGRPDAPIQPTFSGLVARALMETPEGRSRYRERLSLLVTNAFDVPALHTHADALLARVRPRLDANEARALERAIAAVKERVAQRRRSLEQQLSEPELKPLRFENGVAGPTGWRAVDEPAGGKMDRNRLPDGREALYIRAGPLTSASWRCKVLLAQGRYHFQAAVRTFGVEELGFGKNKGVGLRVSAGGPLPPCELLGDNDWTRLEQAFEIGTDQEVELICELRARKGEVWFDLDSLRLVKLP
jgi:spore coat protein H